MTKHKPYKDRKHVDIKDTTRWQLILKRRGVKTNVGDPNNKGLTGGKSDKKGKK